MQSHSGKRKTELKYRCYYYSIEIIRFLGTLPEQQVYRVLANQLLRSATSIGANIVEAQSSSSRRDFTKFYEVALKSANESKYWLGLLRDATRTNKVVIEKLLSETEEISRMLGSSVITLKQKR